MAPSPGDHVRALTQAIDELLEHRAGLIDRLRRSRLRRQRHADRLHRELLQKQRFGTLLILLGPAVLALVLAIPADGGKLPYLFAVATSVIGAGFRDRVSARIRRARTCVSHSVQGGESTSTPPSPAG
jgi:hypothetical protein